MVLWNQELTGLTAASWRQVQHADFLTHVEYQVNKYFFSDVSIMKWLIPFSVWYAELDELLVKYIQEPYLKYLKYIVDVQSQQ